jgi:hypothetical protein
MHHSNLDLKERRELYKAMRSAHDGICPCCGGLALIQHVDFSCESCDFTLSGNEVETIKSWHEEFHNTLPAILAKWRAS